MAKGITQSGCGKNETQDNQKNGIDAAQEALKENANATPGGTAEPNADKENENQANMPGNGEQGEDAGHNKEEAQGEPKAEAQGSDLQPIFVLHKGETLTFAQAAALSDSSEVVRACSQILAIADGLSTSAEPHLLSEEEAEKLALQFVEKTDILAQAESIVNRAKQIIAEKNAPAPKTEEELKAEQYALDVAKYGKDFVTAKKGEMTRKFSRQAWNSLGKNTNGWEEYTEPMPELSE